MSSAVSKVFIDYTQYGIDVQDIIEQLRNKFPNTEFSGVFGIPRGGVPLATHMSYELNIPIFYDFSFMKHRAEGLFIVCDDVSDSGATFSRISELLVSSKTNTKDILFVSLYKKPRSTVVPDVYLREYDNNEWIVFPWEGSYDTVDKDYMV